jgi:hypothetical protein
VSDPHELAERVRRIRSEWEAATVDGAAACGLPVAADAYRRMCQAWSAELAAHAAALDGLTGAGHGQ